MREIQVSDHLRERLREKEGNRRNRIIAGLVILLVFAVIGAVTHIGFLLIGGIAFLCILASAFIPGSGEIPLKEGIKGENILRARLREMLSDEYIALFNLPISKGDVDCFVVGPTGAYLIDAKNHNGYILYCNREWSQKKIGRRGTVYSGEHMKAPDLQVRRAVHEIKDYLRQKGVKIWIEGAVVFTNPEVKVFCEYSKGIKILKICELESLFSVKKHKIKPEQVETIAKLILSGFGKKADKGMPDLEIQKKGGETNEKS